MQYIMFVRDDWSYDLKETPPFGKLKLKLSPGTKAFLGSSVIHPVNSRINLFSHFYNFDFI